MSATSNSNAANRSYGAAKPSKRQRQIYVEAARLFVERGFGGTSMSDLAEAVNLTKAGLYYSISSKEDLLFTVIQFGLDAFDENVLHPAMDVADPLSRLKLALRLHVLNTARAGGPNGNPVTIVVEQVSALSPQRQKLVARRKYRYIAFLRDTLEDLRGAGLLYDDIDSTVAAFLLSAMVLGIARWRKPEGRLSIEGIGDRVVAMALASVLKPKAGARGG